MIPYANEAIQTIMVSVPGDDSGAREFSFCLNSVSP
jgi:hypothetical protein